MASLKCGFCGYGIHYHGEPEGTEPIEHIFCSIEHWRTLEQENLPADSLEIENDDIFFYAWRCVRCNTFTFFNDRWKYVGTYTPREEFYSELMQEPFEFGPFWNDFQWFEITESDNNLASEVLTKFPSNRWFAKNDSEFRVYEDEALTKCVAQFKRIEVAKKITVQSMSLNAFKKMLANWNDIEFRYRGVYYNFIRDKDKSVKIWRSEGYVAFCYSAKSASVEEIINAKIFDDNKSIAEAQAEIEL